ncbi:MAG: T9SS type A sorting domain-containing protein [Bacteroidia bacterium]
MKTLLKKQFINFTRKALVLLITGLSVFNNSNAQTNVTGGIFSNTAWTPTGSPYIITDTVRVLSGVTLTIQPGVVVKFNNGGLLENSGTLIANGTPSDSIIFTSNSTSPYAGIWNCIQYCNSFSYCRISYSAWGIWITNLPVSHCLFNSNLYGIYSANNNIDTCTFKYDSTGLRLGTNVIGCQFMHNGTGDNGSTGIVFNCNFTRNTTGCSPNGSTISYCTFDSNYTAIYDPNDTVRNCVMEYNNTALESYGGGYFTLNNVTNNNIGISSTGGATNPFTLNNISDNYIGIETSGADVYSCNTICNNSHYNIVMDGSVNSVAKGNYWCLADSAQIQATIYDAYQNFNLGFVYFTAFDTMACGGTPAPESVMAISGNINAVKIYPNPSTGNVQLECSLPDGNYSINITDILGQNVYANTIKVSGAYKGNIDMTGYSPGVYIFSLRGASSSFEKRVVIER